MSQTTDLYISAYPNLKDYIETISSCPQEYRRLNLSNFAIIDFVSHSEIMHLHDEESLKNFYAALEATVILTVGNHRIFKTLPENRMFGMFEDLGFNSTSWLQRSNEHTVLSDLSSSLSYLIESLDTLDTDTQDIRGVLVEYENFIEEIQLKRGSTEDASDLDEWFGENYNLIESDVLSALDRLVEIVLSSGELNTDDSLPPSNLAEES